MNIRLGVDATSLVKNRTGVGNYIYRLLIQILASEDIDLHLFSNSDIFFPTHKNVTIHISTPKRRGPYWQNTHLRKMLFDAKPQVYWGANGLMPLIRPRAMATVVTIHDLVYKYAPHTLPFHSRIGRSVFQAMAVQSADCVLAVSDATAFDMEKVYGRKPDSVIRPLVDASFRRPDEGVIREVINFHHLKRPYLFTLGTLEPRKNLATLINAYLTRRSAGCDLPELVIAGGKGWLDSDIERVVSRGEEIGQIRRLGYVRDDHLPALYAGCHAFLMPSIYEGFGMPLLEAQLCGAPVIHGIHSSMIEASGGLGVATNTDQQSLEATLEAMARNELSLACRMYNDAWTNPSIEAARLMDAFHSALTGGTHK